MAKFHPPEPVNTGWMTDNCGNVVAWMRPSVLSDLIGDMEAGDMSLALAVLKEIQAEIEKLPSLFGPYEADTEIEHGSQENY
jgi:hypothetical protein